MSPASKPTGDAAAGARDALALLKADHDKVKRLFRQFDALRSSIDEDERKCELVDEICYELTVHSMIEEDIFYPEVRGALLDDTLIGDAEFAHAGARELVRQLEVLYPGDAHFDATVTVLGEEIAEHIDQEESTIFDAVRQAGIDLDDLGEQLALRKRALDDDLTAPRVMHEARRAHDGTRRPPRAPN